MNCEILETLYIRSNGDIPCNDDAGEHILLERAEIGAPLFNPDSAFASTQYSIIRSALARDVAPWPGTCSRCAFFRPHEPLLDGLARKRIRKIQVEPSLACNLRCPCCNQHLQARYRPKPFLMPMETFATILRGLTTHNYTVSEIEYCGQGEPLMHPHFPEFVKLAREHFPKAIQRLITNGNFDYWDTTGGEPIDEIFVSCDGALQPNYEKYRIRGEVARPLRFMEAIPKAQGGRRQKVVWKYILFEFNDSDDELILAQKIAQDIGVDILLFVFTHSRFKSIRFTRDNSASFPILYPNVITSATPIHFRLGRKVSPAETWQSPRSCATCGCVFMFDALTVDDRRLEVCGWALSKRPIQAIRLSLDEKILGYAVMGESRPDVHQVYPGYNSPNSGFRLNVELEEFMAGYHVLRADLLGENGRACSFERAYDIA